MQITPYFSENIQNKDIFSKFLNNLVIKQDAYNKVCSEVCYCLAEEEAQRFIEENKKKDKKNLINNKKDEKIKEGTVKDLLKKNFEYYLKNNILKDSLNKKENLVKRFLDNKNEYVKCISETDKAREKYNKLTEDLLNNLQKQFKILIYLFQSLVM